MHNNSHKGIALPGLRLTFGGRPCAYEFCVASKFCTDLANDLLHAKDWNPRKVFSPHAKNIPVPILLDNAVHFGQAAEEDVDLEADSLGRADHFVDDGMIIVPDKVDNRLWGAGALPFVIHILCQPLAPNEAMLRDDPLSLSIFRGRDASQSTNNAMLALQFTTANNCITKRQVLSLEIRFTKSYQQQKNSSQRALHIARMTEPCFMCTATSWIFSEQNQKRH